MNEIAIYKALANDARRHILLWLKYPKRYFSHWDPSDAHLGVCCGFIQQKSGLSQSTVSTYLASLEQCDLLIASRHKQWTYYRRNEEVIKVFCKHLSDHL